MSQWNGKSLRGKDKEVGEFTKGKSKEQGRNWTAKGDRLGTLSQGISCGCDIKTA